MKIPSDTELAKHYSTTSATVGNYRKAEGGKHLLYLAMLEYFEKNTDDIDQEYFIEDTKDYWVFRTIRDSEPLFAYFPKSNLAVGTFSMELEDDIDKIKEIVHRSTTPIEFEL